MPEGWGRVQGIGEAKGGKGRATEDFRGGGEGGDGGRV